MSQPTNYPSPTAAQEEVHPFYNTNQHHMPIAEHSHIPPPAAAPMHGGAGETRDFGQVNHNGQNMRQHQPSTPQQLAQRGLDVDQSQDGTNPDSSSRKRSKVSRACDECRRKKIRCDAESETPGTQCSACRRSGGVCDFSRAPQKRGPSKGYIKELAERVNLLEYNRGYIPGATPPEMQYAPIIQEQPGGYPQTSPNDYGSRKRTYDLVDGPPGYNNNQYQPQDYATQQRNAMPDALPREAQTHKTVQSDLHIHSPVHTSHLPVNAPQQPRKMWLHIPENKRNLDIYYEMIHPHLPVLPSSRQRVEQDLHHHTVPIKIGDALFAALDAAICSCTSASFHPLDSSIALLGTLRLEEELSDRSLNCNLYGLQILIFFVLASENAGPLPPQHGATIATAVQFATSLRLHQSRTLHIDDNDVNSLTGTSRRLWLVLTILDRWKAAGTAGMSGIPEEAIHLTRSDEAILGTSAYQLAQLSMILGDLTNGWLYSESGVDTPQSSDITRMMRRTLNTFSLVVEAYPTLHHLRLAYLHVQLLADRYLERNISHASRIIKGAVEIASLLRRNDTEAVSPLTHHWAALAAITLVECVERMGHRESIVALHELRSCVSSGHLRSLESAQADATAWDKVISAFITKRIEQRGPQGPEHDTGRGGLEHLADAAVSKSKTANDGKLVDDTGSADATSGDMPSVKVAEPFDWEAGIAGGYLNVLKEGLARETMADLGIAYSQHLRSI